MLRTIAVAAVLTATSATASTTETGRAICLEAAYLIQEQQAAITQTLAMAESLPKDEAADYLERVSEPLHPASQSLARRASTLADLCESLGS